MRVTAGVNGLLAAGLDGEKGTVGERAGFKNDWFNGATARENATSASSPSVFLAMDRTVGPLCIKF